jgi:SAM-dependent methyltransferase
VISRALLLALALSLAACASAPPVREPSRPLDVPYVATDERVVKAALELAGVTKDDVVMDLGCGDGRIVIAAAQRGARGIGIDLDPQRILEANANARAAGVESLVRFVEGDIFDADISGATVVFLYLLPEINLELRPKLLRELKPGTRVVSHNFDMGDWEPDRTVRVPLRPNRIPILYLWTIPARR